MVRISFLTLGTHHHTQITSSSFTHLDRSHDAVSEDRQFSSDGPHPLLKLGHVGRGGQHAREVVVSCTRSGTDGGLSLLVTAATAARPVLGAQRLRKTIVDPRPSRFPRGPRGGVRTGVRAPAPPCCVCRQLPDGTRQTRRRPVWEAPWAPRWRRRLPCCAPPQGLLTLSGPFPPDAYHRA